MVCLHNNRNQQNIIAYGWTILPPECWGHLGIDLPISNTTSCLPRNLVSDLNDSGKEVATTTFFVSMFNFDGVGLRIASKLSPTAEHLVPGLNIAPTPNQNCQGCQVTRCPKGRWTPSIRQHKVDTDVMTATQPSMVYWWFAFTLKAGIPRKHVEFELPMLWIIFALAMNPDKPVKQPPFWLTFGGMVPLQIQMHWLYSP